MSQDSSSGRLVRVCSLGQRGSAVADGDRRRKRQLQGLTERKADGHASGCPHKRSHAASIAQLIHLKCNSGQGARHRWHLRQWWQFRICTLQNLNGPVGFESHPLRHPSPIARCARGFGWQAASVRRVLAAPAASGRRPRPVSDMRRVPSVAASAAKEGCRVLRAKACIQRFACCVLI